MKYTAKVIQRTVLMQYVDGTPLDRELTEWERLCNGMFCDPEYQLIELFKDCGTIEANTLKELNDKAWELGEQLQLGIDISTFITKGRKLKTI
jgi:hypothetical protein